MPVDPSISARLRGQAVVTGRSAAWVVSTNRPTELDTEVPPGQLAPLLVGGTARRIIWPAKANKQSPFLD